MGQKSENFCGATQIDDHSSARRCANTHLSLVTGEKPVGPYWENVPFSPPSAVHSTESFLPPLHHRRLAVRSLSAYSSASSVSSFLPWRKFNAVKHALSSPPFCFLQLPQKQKIIFGEIRKNPDRHETCPDGRNGFSADIRTPSRRGTQCRRPECPVPPAAGRDRHHAAACRTTCGSRSRRS